MNECLPIAHPINKLWGAMFCENYALNYIVYLMPMLVD